MFALMLSTASACSNEGFANFLAASRLVLDGYGDSSWAQDSFDEEIWGDLEWLQYNGAPVGKLTDAIDGMCEGREKYCVKMWVQDYSQNLGNHWSSYQGRFDECLEQGDDPCESTSMTRAEAEACGLLRKVSRGAKGIDGRLGRMVATLRDGLDAKRDARGGGHYDSCTKDSDCNSGYCYSNGSIQYPMSWCDSRPAPTSQPKPTPRPVPAPTNAVVNPGGKADWDSCKEHSECEAGYCHLDLLYGMSWCGAAPAPHVPAPPTSAPLPDVVLNPGGKPDWENCSTNSECASNSCHIQNEVHTYDYNGLSWCEPAEAPRFEELGAGYCRDWRYPSTGTTSGGYDNDGDTAEHCQRRCMAKIAGTTSFYLKGTQCGCSASTSGPCTVISYAGYTSYEIKYGPSFEKLGDGYCTDYRYPSTGTTSGGYDSVSDTAEACMQRCVAKIPGTTSFYLKGTQCGCSASTSGTCTVRSYAGYTSYKIKY